MSQEAKADPGATVRNRAARASLVSSIVFLIPTLLVAANFALNQSSPPSLQNAAEIAFEVTFLCFPLFYIASVVPIILAVAGLVSAGRLPGRAGQTAAAAGLALGLLGVMLCVYNFFQTAAAFKQ